MRVLFSPPDITQDDIDAVAEVMRSGWITTGPKTKEFERQLALFCGTGRAVCLSSATAALELTLRLLGIGPGDEVITSAYTYTASASVIAHTGARVVLADVDPGSYHISPARVSDAVTQKTKAVIAVDIAGVPCDYDALAGALEGKKRLYRPKSRMQSLFGRPALIADAAHSLGASYKNRPVGSVADFTCFSFHAVKNLTTAEGGAVTWRQVGGMADADLYKEFMLLALHGQDKDALAKLQAGSWGYDIRLLGYKCNMTDMAAALGVSQLSRYPKTLQKRRSLIAEYDRALCAPDLEALRHFTDEYVSSGHLYPVRLLGRDEAFRDGVIRRMALRGVAANVHYRPLPMHSAYRKMGFDMRDFPGAYAMYQNEITLPLYSAMTEDEIGWTIDAFLRECAARSAACM